MSEFRKRYCPYKPQNIGPSNQPHPQGVVVAEAGGRSLLSRRLEDFIEHFTRLAINAAQQASPSMKNNKLAWLDSCILQA
jgi:hypothetical protein